MAHPPEPTLCGPCRRIRRAGWPAEATLKVEVRQKASLTLPCGGQFSDWGFVASLSRSGVHGPIESYTSLMGKDPSYPYHDRPPLDPSKDEAIIVVIPISPA